jgi:hypothetical protein
MGLEAASFLNDLVTTNPVSSDTVAQGDDHLRLLKAVLKATFPSISYARYIEQSRADLASAATPDLWAQTTNYVNITGTTTITDFVDASASGQQKLVRFNGILTLTHGAATIDLPGGANIVTAAGDHALFVSQGTTLHRCIAYFRASGAALIASPFLGTEATITPQKGDLIPLQEVSDSDAPKRATAQSVAETARITIELQLFKGTAPVTTGDGAGGVFFHIPEWMNGFNLVDVDGSCFTAGVTSSMLVQVHNITQAADMLSSRLTFATTEAFSSTATIDAANDDVATGDRLRIDVDQVHTTPAQGLVVALTFERP